MPEWLQWLLGNYGYPVLFLAVFLNNAGLPIPGDTMVLGCGFLAEDGLLSLGWVIFLATLACFSGGTFGYWVGRKLGRKLILRSRLLHLTPEKVEQMDRFFHKHGPKTIFFSRFVALLHPVTGILAGISKTPFLPFLAYNLAGSVAYAVCYSLVGYFFGESWEALKSWVGRGALYGLALLVVFILLTLLLRRPLAALFAHQAGKGPKTLNWFSELRHKIFKTLKL